MRFIPLLLLDFLPGSFPSSPGRYIEDCGAPCIDHCARALRQFEGRCYVWIGEPKSWWEAERHCRHMGGHIASITSDSIHVNLRQMMEDNRQDGIWIGATYNTAEEKWGWSDCENFHFTQWQGNQPDNLTKTNIQGEQCLELAYLGWNDQDCTKTSPFVCSKKMCPSKNLTKYS